jgi:hypothetical protein
MRLIGSKSFHESAKESKSFQRQGRENAKEQKSLNAKGRGGREDAMTGRTPAA